MGWSLSPPRSKKLKKKTSLKSPPPKKNLILKYSIFNFTFQQISPIIKKGWWRSNQQCTIHWLSYLGGSFNLIIAFLRKSETQFLIYRVGGFGALIMPCTIEYNRIIIVTCFPFDGELATLPSFLSVLQDPIVGNYQKLKNWSAIVLQTLPSIIPFRCPWSLSVDYSLHCCSKVSQEQNLVISQKPNLFPKYLSKSTFSLKSPWNPKSFSHSIIYL